MEEKFIVVMKQIMLQILKTYLSIIHLTQKVPEPKNFTIPIQVDLQKIVLLKQNIMLVLHKEKKYWVLQLK